MNEEEILTTLKKLEERLERIETLLISHVEDQDITIANSPRGEEVEMPVTIARLFTRHEILVEGISHFINSDNAIDEIARYMGDNYGYIEDLLDQIKRHIQKHSFTFSLKKISAKQRQMSERLVRMLEKQMFIEGFKNNEEEQNPALIIQNARHPKAISFLNGEWLERYVQQRVNEIAADLELEEELGLLKNPVVKLWDGTDFEFDLLCSMNKEIYWLESKSGEYIEYIKKYSNIAKHLKLKPENVFVIVPHVTKEECVQLKDVFGVSIVNLDTLPNQLYHCFLSHK